MSESKEAVRQTKFSKPQRHYERGDDNRININAVLDSALLCHLGYVLEGRPIVTPTAFWRDGDYVYWHGSSASRMMRVQSKAIDICFTVSILDALVLARSAFSHSVNYRSVMLFGKSEKVASESQKRLAMGNFMEHLLPNRNAELRAMTTQELTATTVLRMAIDEGAVKIRQGPPKDNIDDMNAEVWVGLGVFDHRIQEWIVDESAAKKDCPQPEVMPAFAKK